MLNRGRQGQGASDRADGPATPVGGASGHFPFPGSQFAMDINGDNDDVQESPWWEVEIETLKSSLKALNVQLFQERKQWLAEKTELERAAQGSSNSSSPLQAADRAHAAARFYSQAGATTRKGGLERSTVLNRGPGLDSTGSNEADGGLQAQVQQLQAQLAAVTTERDAAKQEVSRLRAETQRWNVERAALEREVEVLRSKGRSGAGDGDDDAMATLEEEKAALQAELDLIKQSLKNNVLVPKTHMANLPQLSGGGASGGSPSIGSKPPVPPTPSGVRSGASASVGGAMGMYQGQDASATIARLNAEITRLQADLYILKDECVPVPKAEFGKLKGVHSEKANVEQEVKTLKQELADQMRLNKMLREEIELIKDEHCAITIQEYDELRRAAAEKTALELKLEAQSKYYAQIPKEELDSLQAARRQLAGLETKLGAMHALSAVNADDMARALQAATDDAADMRVKLMESESTVAELRKEVVAGEGRAQMISELQDKLRATEQALQATQLEKSRLQIRIRALEDELDASRKLLLEAQTESTRMSKELGQARDANSGLAQEVSQLSRERGELEARVSSLVTDRETLTAELVDAKLELARLREMEVMYKKNVVVTKKQLYGMPSQM